MATKSFPPRLKQVLPLLLLTPPLLLASALSTTAATVPKRNGKHSYLRKQTRRLDVDSTHPLSPRAVLTPVELHELALSLSRREPGSRGFNRGWVQYRHAALDSIRDHLHDNLPHPPHGDSFERLFFDLGVASDVGRMPSFDDAGARSAYALEFFCRARNLADAYMDGFDPNRDLPPSSWLSCLRDSPLLGGGGGAGGCRDGVDGGKYSVVSLGGGPGFDYVSAAVTSSFCSYMNVDDDDDGGAARDAPLRLEATIFDYEEGWADLVDAVANSTRRVLHPSGPTFRCDWGGKCDITRSMRHANNAGCASLLGSADMWVCQYCVAENARALRGSDYAFFRELFEGARPGSTFVLTEVHPRLWPEFYGLVEDCPYMEEVGFNKNGRQMLLRKRGAEDGRGSDVRGGGPRVSEKDRRLLTKFEELGRYHERKIDSGWRRQAPKVRGGKVSNAM